MSDPSSPTDGPSADANRVEREIGAVVRATIVAAVVVGAFALLQGAVGGAFVSGTQPVGVVADVPSAPNAAQWANSSTRTVSLSRQQMALPWGGGSVDEVNVTALTNQTHVGFRLAWADPTNDSQLNSPTRFADAAAVMLKGGGMPPITMGAVGEPVNIWYWRSSWQYGAGQAEWTGDMYTYPHNDTITRPGTYAGNPLSKASYETYGQNYYAAGFGSLSTADVQPVRATGRRTVDGWEVTFLRKQVTNGTHDAIFEEHDTMYLAFAVWNGSADEVNGKKSITLQFTQMDTSNGSLAAVQTSGGGANGGQPSNQAAPQAPSDSRLSGWIAILVGVALFTWLAAYWRFRS